MKKRLPIIISVLIILGCIGYIVYDCTTDFVVKKTILFIKEDAALQADVQKIIDSHITSTENSSAEETATTDQEKADSAEGVSGGNSKSNTEQKPSVVYSKGDDGVLSIDDLQPDDKAYVMSIYYRFSAGEVNTVSQMMADGITVEEKRIIKNIVYAKVSQSEVDKLFAIARKYE